MMVLEFVLTSIYPDSTPGITGFEPQKIYRSTLEKIPEELEFQIKFQKRKGVL